MRNKNGEAKFKPSVNEANANHIMHLLPPKGTVSNYQTTAWQCGLRGDRDEKQKSFLKSLKQQQDPRIGSNERK
jgi:hypothetical protein